MLDLATEFVHLETEKNSLREKLEESWGELFVFPCTSEKLLVEFHLNFAIPRRGTKSCKY